MSKSSRLVVVLRISNWVSSVQVHWPAIIVFGLVAILPFTWINETEVLAWGDAVFPGHVEYNTSRYTWAERFYSGNLGRYAFGAFVGTPFYLFTASLQGGGLTPGTAQRIVLYGAFFLSGFLTYLAALSVLRTGRLAAILTGLLYTLNLHALAYIWMPQLNVWSFWALMPATLALCVKAFQERNAMHFALLQMALLLDTPAFENPVYIILVWGGVLSIAFYLVISGEQRLRFVLVRIASVGVAWLMLNAWWILPNIYAFSNAIHVRYSFEESVSSYNMVKNITWNSSILNSWRMIGSSMLPSFLQKHWSAGYYSSRSALAFIGFLLPVLSIVGVMASRRSKMALYFVLMWILSLFLAKGIHPPLGQVMQWGFDNIPGFLAFRNSMEKFGHWMIMSQCFLVGYGVEAIIGRMRSQSSRVILTAVIAVLLCGVYMWPAWTGTVASRLESTLSSVAYAVRIPDSYGAVSQMIAGDQDDFFVMVVPKAGSGSFPNWYTYTWGYQGVELFTHSLDKPSLVPMFLGQGGGNIAEYIYKAMASGIPDLDKYLAMFNIKYIVIHNDINREVQDVESPELLNRVLGKQNGLVSIGDFAELSVYRIDGVLPAVYATQDVVGVVGDIGNLGDLVSLDSYRREQTYLFSITQQLSYGIEDGEERTLSHIGDSQSMIVVPKVVGEPIREERHVFEVVVPRTADYELLVNADHSHPIELYLDGAAVSPGPKGVSHDTDTASRWYSRGSLLLSEGRHTFGISISPSPAAPALLLRQSEVPVMPSPQVDFARQNPTRYSVHVRRATEPFMLVLLTTYHPGWMTKGVCGGGQVKAQHMLVNGYANGWWIDDRGDCDLIVEFWPQRLSYLGFGVSAASLLLGCLWILRSSRTTKSKPQADKE